MPCSRWATVTPGFGWSEIPAEGATPSAPERGDLIAHYARVHDGFVYVYADGRVILYADVGASAPFGAGRYQLLEVHLSPSGVYLVQSGALEAWAFLQDDSSVPREAWGPAIEVGPYVPSRFAVCYYQGDPGSTWRRNLGYEFPPAVVPFFPTEARGILGGELTHGEAGRDDDPYHPECSAVTIEEARALDSLLEGVRVVDAQGNAIFWEMTPILPHGARAAWYREAPESGP
jgi:hypothetical protein